MRTLIIVISLLMVAGCSQNAKQVVYSGLFEATEINLSSPEAGRIIKFPFREGDTLKSGELVAQLDAERLEIEKSGYEISLKELEIQKVQSEAQVSLTRITLQGAEREYNRLNNLLAKKSATEQQVDNAKTSRDQASAQLKASQAALDLLQYKKELLEKNIRLVNKRIADCQITSPVEGTMIKKYYEESEVIPAGAPIGSVADLSKMELTIYLAQADLGKVKIGDSLPIAIDSHPGQKFYGNVSWISDKAEFTPKNVQTRETRSEMVFALKLSVDNPDKIFKIGMPAEVLWTH